MFGTYRPGPRCPGPFGSSSFQLNQVNQHPCKFGVTKKPAYRKGNANLNVGFSTSQTYCICLKKLTKILVEILVLCYTNLIYFPKVNGLIR